MIHTYLRVRWAAWFRVSEFGGGVSFKPLLRLWHQMLLRVVEETVYCAHVGEHSQKQGHLGVFRVDMTA